MGLHALLQGTSGERPAWRGLLLSWFGIGLTLPFYGAEVFGLYAVGQEAIRLQDVRLIDLAGDIRFGPGFVMILAGLILLGIGTVLAASAAWTSRIVARWSGIPLAVGFVLYLPQYMGSQPIRIAHGLLIAVGCIWVAASMRSPKKMPPDTH